MIEILKDKVNKPNIDNNDQSVTEIVERMLKKIKEEGENAVLQYAKELDGYNRSSVILTKDEIEQACNMVPNSVKEDINQISNLIKLFAIKQRESLSEFECTLPHGVVCGQKIIPLEVAGCYVPGGRYAHVTSAVMSCMTAHVAG